MMITDMSPTGAISLAPPRSAPLSVRLWSEVVFEYRVWRLRRQVMRELCALPDRLLEDIGTYRGDIRAHADASARTRIEQELIDNGRQRDRQQ